MLILYSLEVSCDRTFASRGDGLKLTGVAVLNRGYGVYF